MLKQSLLLVAGLLVLVSAQSYDYQPPAGFYLITSPNATQYYFHLFLQTLLDPSNWGPDFLFVDTQNFDYNLTNIQIAADLTNITWNQFTNNSLNIFSMGDIAMVARYTACTIPKKGCDTGVLKVSSTARTATQLNSNDTTSFQVELTTISLDLVGTCDISAQCDVTPCYVSPTQFEDNLQYSIAIVLNSLLQTHLQEYLPIMRNLVSGLNVLSDPAYLFYGFRWETRPYGSANQPGFILAAERGGGVLKTDDGHIVYPPFKASFTPFPDYLDALDYDEAFIVTEYAFDSIAWALFKSGQLTGEINVNHTSMGGCQFTIFDSSEFFGLAPHLVNMGNLTVSIAHEFLKVPTSNINQLGVQFNNMSMQWAFEVYNNTYQAIGWAVEIQFDLIFYAFNVSFDHSRQTNNDVDINSPQAFINPKMQLLNSNVGTLNDTAVQEYIMGMLTYCWPYNNLVYPALSTMHKANIEYHEDFLTVGILNSYKS